MVSFRMKILLCIASILLVAAAFFYIPASHLVYLSLIPAIVYGFVTKRFFLVLISILVFATTILLFFAMYFQVEGLVEMIDMIIYLYQVIYPYRLAANITEFLLSYWLGIISAFIIMILIIGAKTRFNTFRIMVIFSYFIMLFTTFFLLVNIFCYLIPPLQDFMLTSPGVHEFLIFMYGVLPFIVLVLSLMFLFTIWDYRERKRHKKDVGAMKKKMGPRTMKIMKYAAVFALILCAICAILFAI